MHFPQLLHVTHGCRRLHDGQIEVRQSGIDEVSIGFSAGGGRPNVQYSMDRLDERCAIDLSIGAAVDKLSLLLVSGYLYSTLRRVQRQEVALLQPWQIRWVHTFVCVCVRVFVFCHKVILMFMLGTVGADVQEQFRILLHGVRNQAAGVTNCIAQDG